MLELKDLSSDPFEQFNKWLKEVDENKSNYLSFSHFIWSQLWKLIGFIIHKVYPEAVIDKSRTMALSTVDANGKPSTRLVLLKDILQNGFVFYTNYESDKARDLATNPNACLLFHWTPPERQVKIQGVVSKVSREQSEKYWQTRARGSQLSAMASPQSRPIKDRVELEKKIKILEKEFENKKVPCPENWGGYRLKPTQFEFWEARPNRLHDRFIYQLDSTQTPPRWTICRLGP